jgi:rubrerythrin
MPEKYETLSTIISNEDGSDIKTLAIAEKLDKFISKESSDMITWSDFDKLLKYYIDDMNQCHDKDDLFDSVYEEAKTCNYQVTLVQSYIDHYEDDEKIDDDEFNSLIDDIEFVVGAVFEFRKLLKTC